MYVLFLAVNIDGTVLRFILYRCQMFPLNSWPYQFWRGLFFWELLKRIKPLLQMQFISQCACWIWEKVWRVFNQIPSTRTRNNRENYEIRTNIAANYHCANGLCFYHGQLNWDRVSTLKASSGSNISCNQFVDMLQAEYSQINSVKIRTYVVLCSTRILLHQHALCLN